MKAVVKTRPEPGNVEYIEMPEPQAAPGPDGEGMRALAEALAGGTMSDEDALFASAPQFRTTEQIEAMTKAMTGQG